jgi:hypothetical protein
LQPDGDLPVNAIHLDSGHKAELFLLRMDDPFRAAALSGPNLPTPAPQRRQSGDSPTKQRPWVWLRQRMMPQIRQPIPIYDCGQEREAILDALTRTRVGRAEGVIFNYGYKLGLRISSDGMITHFSHSPARRHDSQLMDDLLDGFQGQ